MAASKSQGKNFTLFMFGLTAAMAGIAYSTSGVGKLALIVGFIVVAVALWGFFKIKPLEGEIGFKAQAAAHKLAGVGVTLLGWLVVLFGLHLTSSVGGRMVTSILGFAISFIGICYVLAPAASKGAIWRV
jgi:hypothetical protein